MLGIFAEVNGAGDTEKQSHADTDQNKQCSANNGPENAATGVGNGFLLTQISAEFFLHRIGTIHIRLDDVSLIVLNDMQCGRQLGEEFHVHKRPL